MTDCSFAVLDLFFQKTVSGVPVGGRLFLFGYFSIICNVVLAKLLVVL